MPRRPPPPDRDNTRLRTLYEQCRAAIRDAGVQLSAADLVDPVVVRSVAERQHARLAVRTEFSNASLADVVRNPAGIFRAAGGTAVFTERLALMRGLSGLTTKGLGALLTRQSPRDHGKSPRKLSSCATLISLYEHGTRPCNLPDVRALAAILQVPFRWLRWGYTSLPDPRAPLAPRALKLYAHAVDVVEQYWNKHLAHAERAGIHVTADEDEARSDARLTDWLCTRVRQHPPSRADAAFLVYWPWCMPVIRQQYAMQPIVLTSLTLVDRRALGRAVAGSTDPAVIKARERLMGPYITGDVALAIPGHLALGIDDDE